MDYNPQFGMPGAERSENPLGPDELNRHIAYARMLRSEAIAAMVGAAFRALARPLRASMAGAARWRRQRATAVALNRCNDRVLADIGIAREDIPLIARGLDPLRGPSPAGPAWRRWPALLAHVEVLAMIQRGMSHGSLRRHPPALADRA